MQRDAYTCERSATKTSQGGKFVFFSHVRVRDSKTGELKRAWMWSNTGLKLQRAQYFGLKFSESMCPEEGIMGDWRNLVTVYCKRDGMKNLFLNEKLQEVFSITTSTSSTTIEEKTTTAVTSTTTLKTTGSTTSTKTSSSSTTPSPITTTTEKTTQRRVNSNLSKI